VPVLWFDEVWRILINVQDKETLFFVAIAIYAGLHQAEICRLDWKHHILRDANGEPTKIYVSPGMDEKKQVLREGRYVTIRYPLNKILMLAKDPTGRVVNHLRTRTIKLSPLLRRLQIIWSQSIMRHTYTSYLHGAGVSLEKVADEIGDNLATVMKHYLRHLPDFIAELLWTLPIDLAFFAPLPLERRFWDRQLPLMELALPGVDVQAMVRGELVPAARPQGPHAWQIVPLQLKPPADARATRVKRSFLQMARSVWPPDDEFQVMLFDMTQEKVARLIKHSEKAVSAYAIRNGFERPSAKDRRRKKAGLEVHEPEAVKQARQRLEQQRAAIAGSVVATEPAQKAASETARPDSDESNPRGA